MASPRRSCRSLTQVDSKCPLVCWSCEALGLDITRPGRLGLQGGGVVLGLRALSVYVEADSWGRVIAPAPKIFKYALSEKSRKIGYCLILSGILVTFSVLSLIWFHFSAFRHLSRGGLSKPKAVFVNPERSQHPTSAPILGQLSVWRQFWLLPLGVGGRGGRRRPRAWSGWRPRRLLHILQCTGQPPQQTVFSPKC